MKIVPLICGTYLACSYAVSLFIRHFKTYYALAPMVLAFNFLSIPFVSNMEWDLI